MTITENDKIFVISIGTIMATWAILAYGVI